MAKKNRNILKRDSGLKKPNGKRIPETVSVSLTIKFCNSKETFERTLPVGDGIVELTCVC